MSNLHKKLNNASEHIVLTQDEKRAMRAAIFGAPSPLMLRKEPSRYSFFASGWMRALAAVLVVVCAGGGTAFASQGALPGQPLYAIKTKIIEPAELALASTPAAKAAVHVDIAQARVAEAEALAQAGTLNASTSAQLADDFESHAHSAVALAEQASSTDPSAAVQVRAQLAVSSSVGSAVLTALGNNEGRGRDHADAFAARVLATVADTSGEGEHYGATVRTVAVAKTSATVRTMAALTTDTSTASNTAPAPAVPAISAAANFEQEKAAQGISAKAQDALAALKAQFASASSSLDATTTVSIETQINGIGTLIEDGNQALNDSIFDTAVQDFTQALSRSLRLSALLDAQHRFDNHLIDPIIKQDSGGDSGSGDGLPDGLGL